MLKVVVKAYFLLSSQSVKLSLIGCSSTSQELKLNIFKVSHVALQIHMCKSLRLSLKFQLLGWRSHLADVTILNGVDLAG